MGISSLHLLLFIILPLIVLLGITITVVLISKGGRSSLRPARLPAQAVRVQRANISCPRCRRALTEGFVVAQRGIAWRGEADKPIGAFSYDKRLLPNTLHIGLSSKENKAWRCEPCGIVLVDHTVLVPVKKDEDS